MPSRSKGWAIIRGKKRPVKVPGEKISRAFSDMLADGRSLPIEITPDPWNRRPQEP